METEGSVNIDESKQDFGTQAELKQEIQSALLKPGHIYYF